MKYIVQKKKCRLCASKKILKVFELCESPLANNLYNNIKSSLNADYFPLNLMLCKNCYHLQLEHVVNSKELFSNYFYMTGISRGFKIHFKKFADDIIKKLGKSSIKNVLEIGSNDCLLLDYFKQKGCKTVGVEPATNLYNLTKKKHRIYNSFYNLKTNKKLIKNFNSFDLILANNVFAHIDNLKLVFSLLKKLMKNKSFIVFEVSYLIDVLNKKLFDTIYHEHLDYHAITPLFPFFQNLKLKIVDIENIPSHGGSIRIYVTKKGNKAKVNKIKLHNFINKEKKIGIKNVETYKKFYNNLIFQRKKIKQYFLKIKGEVVYGYGAPAKAVTMLNFFQLNHKNIKLIIDDSQLKQNKYIPGTKIKICDSKILLSKPPKFIIILAWNLYKDILPRIIKNKELKYIIIPFPNFRIIKI